MTTNPENQSNDFYRSAPLPAEHFFDRIRRQGLVRSEDRWFGGVSGMIAARLGWNTGLVRLILFVLVLCFGFGALLYGLAWAFLPEPDSRIHAQEVLQGRWTAGVIGAGVVPLVGLCTPGFWTGPGFLLLAAAGLWLIFSGRDRRQSGVNTPGGQNFSPDGR